MDNKFINFIGNIGVKKENILTNLKLYTDSKQILKLIYEHDKQYAKAICDETYVTEINNNMQTLIEDMSIKILKIDRKIDYTKEPIFDTEGLYCELSELCNKLWNMPLIQREINRNQGSSAVYDDGFFKKGTTTGIERIILTMCANDICQRSYRTGLGNFGQDLDSMVVKMHKMLTDLKDEYKIIIYGVATVVREVVYVQCAKSSWNNEPFNFVQNTTNDQLKRLIREVCFNTNCLTEGDFEYQLDTASSIVTPNLIISGVSTVLIRSYYKPVEFMSRVVPNTKRFPIWALYTTAGSRTNLTDVLLVSTVIDKRTLQNSDYWGNIITKRGFKRSVLSVVITFWLIMIIIFIIIIWSSVNYEYFFDNRTIDVTNLISVTILLEGIAATAFVAFYNDEWTWYDMFRGQVFVKDWNQLPIKYKTEKSKNDYIKYIIHHPAKNRYMDPETNCYPFGKAEGQLKGPELILIETLKLAGVLAINQPDGTISLTLPRKDKRIEYISLIAENYDENENKYHIASYGPISNSADITDGEKYISY
jgi:hypothetical protein